MDSSLDSKVGRKRNDYNDMINDNMAKTLNIVYTHSVQLLKIYQKYLICLEIKSKIAKKKKKTEASGEKNYVNACKYRLPLSLFVLAER